MNESAEELLASASNLINRIHPFQKIMMKCFCQNTGRLSLLNSNTSLWNSDEKSFKVSDPKKMSIPADVRYLRIKGDTTVKPAKFQHPQ